MYSKSLGLLLVDVLRPGVESLGPRGKGDSTEVKSGDVRTVVGRDYLPQAGKEEG